MTTLTLREFLTEESARCYQFVTFTVRGKSDPFVLFTATTIALQHPKSFDRGVVAKEHPLGHVEDSWMDVEIFDGITIREVF